MLYIASPYSHEDIVVRRDRYKQVVGVTAKLTLDGWKVYSPIVHSHPLVEFAQEPHLPNLHALHEKDHDFWLSYDRTFMRLCDRLVVVAMLGWETSKGIRQEVEFFKNLRRPMALVSPEIISLPTFAQINWREDITLIESEA